MTFIGIFIFGEMPFLLHVHWPNSALPSKANLDVPHPLSFAA